MSNATSDETLDLKAYCALTGQKYFTVCRILRKGLQLEGGYVAVRVNHKGLRIPRYRVRKVDAD